MLREVLLTASSSEALRQVVEKAPVSRHVVARYIAGPGTAEAVRATADLVDQDLLVTIDHLGEDTVERAQADQVTTAYLELLEALARDGLTRAAEVSVKLSAVGQALTHAAVPPSSGARSKELSTDSRPPRLLPHARRRACSGGASSSSRTENFRRKPPSGGRATTVHSPSSSASMRSIAEKAASIAFGSVSAW